MKQNNELIVISNDKNLRKQAMSRHQRLNKQSDNTPLSKNGFQIVEKAVDIASAELLKNGRKLSQD